MVTIRPVWKPITARPRLADHPACDAPRLLALKGPCAVLGRVTPKDRFPVMSQAMIDVSRLAVYRVRPSGVKAPSVTGPLCPARVNRDWPVLTSHIVTAPPGWSEAAVWPLGDKTMLASPPACSPMPCRTCPVRRSSKYAAPLLPLTASVWPSRLTAPRAPAAKGRVIPAEVVAA